MKIAGIVKESIVDGPGIRYTIFTQGCPHHCHGCHNESTWDPNGGKEVDVEDICKEMKENPLIDGITLSGGEPFMQAEDCIRIAMEARHSNMSVWCYTGYTYEYLMNMYNWKNNGKQYISNLGLLKYIDVLVDGRFDKSKKSLDLKFCGSTNQRIIDVQESIKQDNVVLYNI